MRRIGLLVLALTAFAATPAEAARVAKVERFSGDLHVLGDATAWNQSRCLRDCVTFYTGRVDLSRFMLKRPGRAAVELARARLSHFPGGSNSRLETVRYAASTESVAKLEREFVSVGDVPSEESRLFAGALEGSLDEVVICGVFDLPVALDGAQLAYDESACAAGSSSVVVRSLEGGPTETVPTQGREPEALALAGDFLAVAARERLEDPETGPPAGALTVWNWRTGAQVSEAPIPAGFEPVLIEVAGSGSAAFIVPGETCEEGRLSVVDPGAAAARAVATGVCGKVSWNGAEIVTRRSDRLVAIAGDGSERTLVDHGSVTLADFAEDGSDLAYALPTCGGDTTIERVELDIGTRGAGAPGCPLAIPRQRLEMGAQGRVRLRLACKRGCSGTARFKGFGVKSFEQDKVRGSVVLRVPKKLARQVRRRGSVRRKVVVQTLDRATVSRKRSRSLRIVRSG
jgi:hypothetical protein